MEAVTRIAPALDPAALLARVHVASDSEDAAAFAPWLDRAREVARPKALYAEAFVEGRGENTLRIAGIIFTSRMLRRRLAAVERVFPYVATCGRELDGVAVPAGDVNVWPIEQQRELFRLLGGVTPAIGVILTESCLMIPNKSVSGLLLASEADLLAMGDSPSRKDYPHSAGAAPRDP